MRVNTRYIKSTRGTSSLFTHLPFHNSLHLIICLTPFRHWTMELRIIFLPKMNHRAKKIFIYSTAVITGKYCSKPVCVPTTWDLNNCADPARFHALICACACAKSTTCGTGFSPGCYGDRWPRDLGGQFSVESRTRSVSCECKISWHQCCLISWHSFCVQDRQEEEKKR